MNRLVVHEGNEDPGKPTGPVPARVAYQLGVFLGPLVKGRVLHLRRLGVSDDAIRRTIMDAAVDRSPFGAFGGEAEHVRERVASNVARALTLALAAPDDPTLNPRGRAEKKRHDGPSVVLADGQAWTFPSEAAYLPMCPDVEVASVYALPVWMCGSGRMVRHRPRLQRDQAESGRGGTRPAQQTRPA